MRPARIVLATLPEPFLTAIRDAIAVDPDLVIVSDAAAEIDVLLAARHADVALVAVEHSGAGLAVVERMLDENCGIAVVACDHVGHHAWLYRHRTTREPLPWPGLSGFADTLRRAATGRSTSLEAPELITFPEPAPRPLRQRPFGTPPQEH